MQTLLALKGIHYSVGEHKSVLAGVDLSAAPGEAIWISGPSGSGKSTLLRIINRLLSPDSGELEFQGRPLDQWPPPALRRLAALMPQQPVMFSGTVEDNLLLSFRFQAAQGVPPPERENMRGLLERLGLRGVDLGSAAERLSVGQQQRVALARTLLMDPALLLLDEPVAALDPDSRALVESEAARFCEQGRAVVMVSHLPPPALDGWRRLHLAGGRLEEAS
jgi:putative ABC transport system ATP-binding protein